MFKYGRIFEVLTPKLSCQKDGTNSQGQQYKTEKKILAPPCDVK